MPLSKNRYSVRECILRLCEAIGLTKSTTVSDTSPQIHVSRMQSKKNTVNIPRDQDDPFWRYRRPELKIEVQGKNQSTVTVLTNLSHVCQGLQTDPRWVHKYCCMVLSTRDAPSKSSDTKVFALRGLHSLQSLNQVLDHFISIILLCPKCKLPEVTLVAGTNFLQQDCRACGHTNKLDVSSKIVHYIAIQLQSGKPAKSVSKSRADQDLDYFESNLKSNPLTQNLYQ